MATSDQAIPSLLVFGPQNRPSTEDLDDLYLQLSSNPLISPVNAALLELPKFRERLFVFDPDLAQVPAGLNDLLKWLKSESASPYSASKCPVTTTFLLNFLIQIKQYLRFLQSVDTQDEADPQSLMIERLRNGGVHGFCVGFLCAIVVALSGDVADLVQNAARALPLAFAIGVYVDKNAVNEATTCISARWRLKQANAIDKALGVLKGYPDAYIAGITDETSMTITIPNTHLVGLVPGLEGHGFSVREIPVDGRFHSSVYAPVVDRLVRFFAQAADLRFPGPDQLLTSVRSATDGTIITSGDLVRYVLQNTLLKPANWYETITLALADIPLKRKCIALAGVSNHFPLSLMKNPDIQLQILLELSDNETGPCNSFSNTTGPEPTTDSNTEGNDTEGSWIFATEENVSDDDSEQGAVPSDCPPNAVAVVGMAGRFPGANTVDELWDLLSEAKSSVKRAPGRIGLDYLSGDYSQKMWWGNFIDDLDTFDHKLFQKSSRETLVCDPQQRKLLEVVYEALESSGYFGAQTCQAQQATDYGCYIGATQNNWVNNVSRQPPSAYATIGTGRSFLSGAVSHYFGWTGPALTIDTACSSSLVAIHTACQAILSGDCAGAVAGGANIITIPDDYRDLRGGGFLSPTGQCKPFDAGADGYCRGEAVAVVVLKPLAVALEDRDHIIGVIRASAVNQNANEAHITVPHSGSQAKLYRKVMDMANIAPDDVTFVEAHATGTTVGDPLEVRSLRDAFGGASRRDSTLYFSSIKGNIGHGESAAGVSNLIKVLLMLKHGQIPPQASHQSLNPNIPALEPDLLKIPLNLTPWTTSKRVACVNSFGAAGSNSAVLVCEPPTIDYTPFTAKSWARNPSKLPLIISAATTSSLSEYAQKMLDWLNQGYLTENPSIMIADVLFHLANRANWSLEHRLIASVSDVNDFKSKLSATTQEGNSACTKSSPSKSLVLVFGGQENQFVGLSRSVHSSSNIFRQHLDDCQALLMQMGLEGLYPAIFQQWPIPDIVTLHTAWFSVQYASAKTWMDCGLHPSAVVGHSFGQLTALCISGVLSLSDAIRLITDRASLIKSHWGSEPGCMLSIQADRHRVTEILSQLEGPGHYAEIACFNGPRSHVVVGTSKSIKQLEAMVLEKGQQKRIRAKRLAVTHGFHSTFTEALLPHLADVAEELEWKEPTIHLELCEEKPLDHAIDQNHVAQHMRRPVYFHQAIERLAEKYPGCLWLEAGRGSSVTQLIRGCLKSPQPHSLLAPQLATASALDSLVDVTIKLWNQGQKVQYWPFHSSQRLEYKALDLPHYQFQKTRYWIPYVLPKVAEDSPAIHPDEPKHHELMRLLRGDKLREADFGISPKSERFKALVSGHVMADRPAMPATLYIEVVARAALVLQEDPAALTWVPSLLNLDMKSPIGIDPESEITLTLKRLDSQTPSWDFSMKLSRASCATPQESATGTVQLNKRTDIQIIQNMKRFENLIGSARLERILNHPDAERMSGKHIYRAFNQVVQYANLFGGIKTLSCLGSDAAGEVSIVPDVNAPADQRLADTPMMDSFMQLAGFLSNYFNERSSPGNLFVCHCVGRVEFGPKFSPDAGRWSVFASLTHSSDESTSVDVYVFETKSHRLVFTAFEMEFSRISLSSLTRIIDGAGSNKPGSTRDHNSELSTTASSALSVPKISVTSITAGTPRPPATERAAILQIIANVADVEIGEVLGDGTLPDIGIDSLGVTEMIGDISSILHVDLDLSTMLALPNINALVSHIDEKLGLRGAQGAIDSSNAGEPIKAQSRSETSIAEPIPQPQNRLNERASGITEASTARSPLAPKILSAYDAFDSVRLRYDKHGDDCRALDYWSSIYKDDARLMVAYITEAFAKLGVDLRKLSPGEAVPELQRTLPRHRQLVHQLHLFLEDEGAIMSNPAAASGFLRTNSVIGETPGELIYQQVVTKHPLNASVRHLLRAVGSQLAECLVGDRDGLQILFGDKTNKKTLEDVYENWPMLVAAARLVNDFLIKAFNTNTYAANGPFRILEVGAGTGGTTRYIVDFLQKHNIKFEYHFTDLSGSLVQKAKRTFKSIVRDGSSMTFAVLDIEQEPPAEFLEAFHIVISTNCIHATRKLACSLTNIRKMLRPDGAVALIEMTRVMYIYDIIVGLLEGWWLFEDGRSHALADEARWTKAMLEAGFKEVLFSDGQSEEAKTVHVIAGFPRSASAPQPPEALTPGPALKSTGFTLQEVVYKTIGRLDIYADIYCPDNADPTRKMPIALMIHGGSHIIFSRKDIRPPQTQIMLDMGLLPVSLDHRLCPEVALAEGGMVDICDALEWARTNLPNIRLDNPSIRPDPDHVVIVGWSSGGQLALSTGWTAPLRGIKPPDAVLAFYSPTDYEDEWWRSPIQPVGAEDWGLEYDVLEAVQDEPITNYGAVGAWAPLSDPRIRTDPRCRIVLHMNWKAQTLPVIMHGLPSHLMVHRGEANPDVDDWNALDQPSLEDIRRCSPLAQVRAGNYATPTFMVHGTDDDLIPYAQSARTVNEMRARGIDAQVVLVPGAPHVCDTSSDPESEGWRAVLQAYKWLEKYVR